MTLGTYHHDQHCPNIANALNVMELRECARCYVDGQAYAAEQHRLRMIAAMWIRLVLAQTRCPLSPER